MGIADVTSGVHAFAALGYALYYREKTGVGQHIDMAMVDALYHMHEVNIQAYAVSGGQFIPSRFGSHHPLICPCGTFKGPPGWIVILVLDRQWPSLVLDPAVLTRSTTEESYADRFTECFMAAAAPGIIATTMLNAYYDSHERYVFTLAEEMRKEYEYIHAQGFILQLDAPDLAIERTFSFQDKSTHEFQQIVAMHVAALNLAIRNIPSDQVRLHVCWGHYDGPHTHDIPLADILPPPVPGQSGALSLEMANLCHQHESKALKKYPLPNSMLLIPGVIDSTVNYVEHQEVAADRICQVVKAVEDWSRVLAGTDCSFGTFTGWEMVARDVVWANLQACSEGARLATQPL